MRSYNCNKLYNKKFSLLIYNFFNDNNSYIHGLYYYIRKKGSIYGCKSILIKYEDF